MFTVLFPPPFLSKASIILPVMDDQDEHVGPN